MIKTCALLALLMAVAAVNAHNNNDDIQRDDFVEKIADPAKDFVSKVVDAAVPELMDNVKAPGFIKKPIESIAKSKAKDFASNQIDKFVDAHDSDEQRLAASDENKSRKRRSLDQLDDNQYMARVGNNAARVPGMRRKKMEAYLDKGLQVLANSAGAVSAKVNQYRNNRRNNANIANAAHGYSNQYSPSAQGSGLHVSSHDLSQAQLYPQQTHLTDVPANYGAFNNGNSPQLSQYNANSMQQQSYGDAAAYSNVQQQQQY